MTKHSAASQQRIDLTSASDQMLLELTRDGMSEAFGELWSRHSRAVVAAVRSSTGFDPDDLMQEAFLKVYASVCDGGPIPVSFRAYVATAARRLAIDQSRRSHGAVLDSFEDEFDHGALAEADFSERVFEDSTTAQAFKELPSRYREVLWYRDVEDLPVQEVARYVGMTPNATTVLIKRAREAFKAEWINVQLSPKRDLAAECASVVPKLAAYSRGKLSAAERGRIDLHLLDCVHCAALESEANELHKKLALVLLPLLLLGGAPTYLAWVQSGENRTPVPAAANYVDVALAGIRRSPVARGTGVKPPFGRPVKSLAMAAAAVSLIAIATGAVAVVRGLEAAPAPITQDAPQAEAEADSGPVTIPGRSTGRTGAPAAADPRAFESQATSLTDGFGSEVFADPASGSTSALQDTEVPAPLDPPDAAPPVTTEPPAEPEPMVYPERVDIAITVSPSYVRVRVTPGATVYLVVTKDAVPEEFSLVDSGSGTVVFARAPYAGVPVELTITQEYDTASGRVLDPVVFSQFVVL